MNNFVTNCLEIVPATLKDYSALTCYHYRTEPIKPVTQIYKVRARTPHTKEMPDPLAVIVYRMPIPDVRPRTHATKGYFHVPTSLSDRLKLVNKNIQYLARLIVDPRFRKIGLATWLLADSLTFQTAPIIETLTPIDYTNRIFLKAGFKLFHMNAPTWYKRFTDALDSIGFADQPQISPWAVQLRIDSLKGKQLNYIDNAFHQFVYHFRHRKQMPSGIDRTKFALSKIPYPKAYLIWFNPRIPIDLES